jgi:HPr kinase/phosphorylase
MMAGEYTIHASAVLVGARAVLIRGPSGAGKSTLAWQLIQAGAMGQLPFVRLVADDRAHVDIHMDRLIVRPATPLVGLIEIRGVGIRCLPYEPLALIGSVIDLGEEMIARHPEPEARTTFVRGVKLPRLVASTAVSAFSAFISFLTTSVVGIDLV